MFFLFMVYGLWFRVSGLGLRVWGVESGDSKVGFNGFRT